MFVLALLLTTSTASLLVLLLTNDAVFLPLTNQNGIFRVFIVLLTTNCNIIFGIIFAIGIPFFSSSTSFTIGILVPATIQAAQGSAKIINYIVL